MCVGVCGCVGVMICGGARGKQPRVFGNGLLSARVADTYTRVVEYTCAGTNRRRRLWM